MWFISIKFTGPRFKAQEVRRKHVEMVECYTCILVNLCINCVGI